MSILLFFTIFFQICLIETNSCCCHVSRHPPNSDQHKNSILSFPQNKVKMMKLATCFTLCFFFVQCVLNLSAFSIPTASTTTSFISASTTTAPPREKTKRKTKFGSSTKERTRRSFRVKAPGGGSPLEYLRDDLTLMPKDDDPFHIILLVSHKRPH